MSSIRALADRMRSGTPALSAWCGIPEPAVAGLLANEGFDAVTLDMQHGGFDFAAAARTIPLVAAAGKPSIARIPVGDFATAARLLDAGASAIISPMINSAEDARLFGGFVKFPPLGQRSWGPYGAMSLAGRQPADYLAEANGYSLALAMIETREALDNLDEILAVPMIDGIFIGPFDLSIALSNGASIAPEGAEARSALDHAFARARAVGKFAGVYAATGETAGSMVRQGYDLVAVGFDAGFLRAGAQATLSAAKR
ncbi:aldolase/citrate lyase family protein [Azospirillum sp. SYSU D00513]|uniref:HpcH/HpaI aldolase family protein n=1 Tax=Azospirillum sp. SYSU D00513 TaxID=2812561 RepID=UPI001A9782B6|nr:aldolase/citrate lyase family protein [Azospirillum sp. SYSU D00513]